MTDDKNSADANDQAAPSGEPDTIVAAAQLSDERGVLAEAGVAVQGDHALVVARFASEQAATLVYQDLVQTELAGSIHIDGVLVVKADPDGRLRIVKMTDHSTRTGLKWGIVGGIVAGIFLPATIIAGAATLGVAGMAAGKARNLARRLDVEHALSGTITPGTSGILALVTALEAPEVEAKMKSAEKVDTVPVDEATAKAIEEAAAAADSGAGAGTAEKPAAG
jgi:uncharacterized membrane protein